MAHNIFKGFFVFSCVDIYILKVQSLKALNLAKNENFSILCLFCRPVFVTKAIVTFI